MEYHQTEPATQELTEHEPEKEAEQLQPKPEDPDNAYIWIQFFVCLFLFAVVFFAYRQGEALWKELSAKLQGLLQNGLDFSGQENLTRLSDEITDFWGNNV